MAAIREWFAVYGVVFEYMEKLGGAGGLANYLDFLGGQMHELTGGGQGTAALPAIRAYFEENLPKDGGECTASLGGDTLEVAVERCPDHAYFESTPYEGHWFGPEYCESCAGAHAGLARAAGCGFEAEKPVRHPDGRYSCRFTFTGAAAGTGAEDGA